MTETCGRKGLEELSEEYEFCSKCPSLEASRSQVVFGSGSSTAPIVIVGEGPGAQEDEEGAVFIGDSGQLLMSMLTFEDDRVRVWPADEELDRITRVQEDETYFEKVRDYLDEYIFWTNAVLCRPEENRTPTAVEVKNCLDRLHRSIYAVDPILVIAAGKTAASALLGKAVAVTDKSGTLFDIGIPSPATGNMVRYPMLVVLHPSFLLREGDQKLVKRKQGKTYETIKHLAFGIRLVERLHVEMYGHSFLEKRA